MLKWTEAETSPSTREGQLPMGKPPDEWTYGDVDAGFKNAALVLDETLRHAEHEPPDARDAHGDGVLAERQAVHALLDAEHRADRRFGGALAAPRAERRRRHQRVHRRRLRQQGDRHDHVDDSGAAVEEG